MYDRIIDPITGSSYKLNTKKGKDVLFNYIKSNTLKGGRGKTKGKSSSGGRNNPLAGSDPISQIYDFYDNFEEFWDNSEEFFELSKHFLNLGLKGYCYVNGGIVNEMCSFIPNTYSCKIPSEFLKDIC